MNCIDDLHILLVQSGIFMGVGLWYSFHFRNGCLLYFSPIQQHGSSQLRSKLYDLVKETSVRVAWNMRWFCLFYFVYGKLIVRKT